MKSLQFTTDKGTFRIVEVLNHEFPSTIEANPDADFVEHVKFLAEAEAAGIVDHIVWNFTSGGSKTMYRNYLSNDTVETALKSLHTLVESKGFYLVNPYPEPIVSDGHFKIMAWGEQGLEDYNQQINDWKGAEAKTFTNPIILKVRENSANFDYIKSCIEKYSLLGKSEKVFTSCIKNSDRAHNPTQYKHTIFLGVGLCKIAISRIYNDQFPIENYQLIGKPHKLTKAEMDKLFWYAKRLL